MEKQKLKLNKMGTAPIGKLLFTMALPAIFSMLIQALYNLVDSLFVAKISGAFLAISIAFPLQTVIVAFALGIGVGTNSIVARKLGEGLKSEADKYAQTGLFLALFCSFLFIIFGTFVPNLFMKMYSSDQNVINMGTTYLTICMICSFAPIIEMLFSKTLQATGNMIVPMVAQLIGAVINIALDPLFIFTFKMGVAGAAVATVIGQCSAMAFSMFMALKRGHIIQIIFKKFKLRREFIGVILKVGFPVLVMNAVGAFVVLIINGIVRGYTEVAIEVLGAYFKLQSFVFMPVFGLTQGALPIMAFNFGANNRQRYAKTLFLTVGVALAIMICGTLLFQFTPQYLLQLFNASPEMMEMGIIALRILSWCFIPAAFGIVMTTGLQSIGYGFSSLIMSMLRQVVIIIPFAILFSKLWGVNAVWYVYPLAEIVTVMVFLPLMAVCVKRAFKRRSTIVDRLKQDDLKM